MPALWLGNACTEHMVDRMDLLTEEDCRALLFTMKRLAWLLRDGDALVVPRPLPQSFLQHVARHTGLDTSSIHLVSPDVGLLTQDRLHSDEVLEPLRGIVTPEWEFRPYIHDRGSVTFAQALGLRTAGSPGFLTEGGAELLNSKVVFRALAAGAGFSVPAGMPCRTINDLTHSVTRLLSRAASVIVKRDRAVSGHGNFVITTDKDLEVTGALSTYHLTDPRNLDEVVAAAGLTSSHAPLGEVVVEEFHPGCRSVYVEVLCPEDGTEPTLVNSGQLRVGQDPPVLAGLELPLTSIPERSWREFSEESLRMARLMQRLGYTGLANIDAVVSPAGELWFNEVNARMGGSTHLHSIAETLVGPDWSDTHTLLSRFNVVAPPLRTLLKELEANALAWDPERRRGVVIASDDTDVSGTVEYVVLAPSRDQGAALEAKLEHILADARRRPGHA
ncbi:peptide ligase PGM1-related protein [Streptomyces lavendulocolor]|uniref:preATP grasp domain-containing protein n=1 Tax=Streptomyces lavendulocolor TaxID=67316 RepID=UPI003C2D2EA1